MSRLLVIFGATGKQGGSVIDAILADKSTPFKLRGITRDPSKANAKALSARGVEMVAADLGDKASLSAALEGAYGVFAVTDYWATMNSATEIQQGKDIADAAKEANVEHFVLSTLKSPKKFTHGVLSKIEHFDGKAEIADYARSIGLPVSYYLPGFYMSNIPGSSLRNDPSSDEWIFSLPVEEDAQIPLVDIGADTGKYVKAIFDNKDQLLGKEVYGSGKYYTPLEIVEDFKNAFPSVKARFVPSSPEEYTQGMVAHGMPKHIAEELTENMILLNKKYGYYDGADLAESNRLIGNSAKTWTAFIKESPAFKELK